ncbi:MAG: 4Fe-4S dicluster domain-containing protein, partial [Candidatus Hydrothermarchaeales archaeon]
MASFPPKFKVLVDKEVCTGCLKCTLQCPFDVHIYDKEGFKASGKDKDERKNFIVRKQENCVACQRCVFTCPVKCIQIEVRPPTYNPHPVWTDAVRRDLKTQSDTGGVLLAAMGNEQPYPSYFDRLVIDACQVTNPSIDPLREPMELRT